MNVILHIFCEMSAIPNVKYLTELIIYADSYKKQVLHENFKVINISNIKIQRIWLEKK